MSLLTIVLLLATEQIYGQNLNPRAFISLAVFCVAICLVIDQRSASPRWVPSAFRSRLSLVLWHLLMYVINNINNHHHHHVQVVCQVFMRYGEALSWRACCSRSCHCWLNRCKVILQLHCVSRTRHVTPPLNTPVSCVRGT